jgi:hypothetical protein
MLEDGYLLVFGLVTIKASVVYCTLMYNFQSKSHSYSGDAGPKLHSH